MPKVSSINRMVTFRPGKGIARKYHNVQNMSRMQASFAGLEAVLAAYNLRFGSLFLTLFTGGLAALFAKRAIDYHNMKVDLWDRYQEIVERAKKIYTQK